MIEAEKIIGDPILETLKDITRRLTDLSDAINSPQGSINKKIEAIATADLAHHVAVERMFKACLDELLEIRQQIKDHEQDILDHDLDIQVLKKESRYGAQVQ